MRVLAVVGVDREHDQRLGDEARRHRPRHDRHDDRGQQHRRRGPARAVRLPGLRGRAGRRADRRRRHADRRHRHRAGLDLRRALRHRRGAGRRGHRGRRGGGRARLADAAAPRVRRADEGPLRRPRRTPTGRKAHPIQGASFLKRFVGDVPWAHLDIAGTGHDNGRAYAAKGGSGWGVRLLVELARAQVPAKA